ncbi:hypothetical protein CRUP_023553, partial [Coryphaenoides rupestris]
PLAPSWLDIQPDQAQFKSSAQGHGGTSGLRVSWRPSPGHVDWYEVLLEDRSGSGPGRSTRVTSSAALQSGFTGLTPGTRYALGVVATSGNKSSVTIWRETATGQTDPLINKHHSR